MKFSGEDPTRACAGRTAVRCYAGLGARVPELVLALLDWRYADRLPSAGSLGCLPLGLAGRASSSTVSRSLCDDLAASRERDNAKPEALQLVVPEYAPT